jgi:uncharacterized protein Yka (UPF0111/DUF47 family)
MSVSVLSLPSELISIIINFLPRGDQLNFSAVSKSSRLHSLAPLFRHFLIGKYDHEIRKAYDHLESAGQEIKHTIKKVVLDLITMFPS